MFALQPTDAAVAGTGFRVDRELVLRELAVAACLGGALALLDFAVIQFWFNLGMDRSFVVSLTVFLIVILGTTAGTILPILLRRAGMDPAIMSNPLIAAIVDILGVVILYEVALFLL